ncbi:hypothetical protein [Marinobacter sp. ELB17]|uniref:hypothetical protein n=1 Tax=Marinobacter sp. ELB17 TaxID=270374 RepID=UPI0000F361BB|nr:hypothetical protein [Marinobacter sp. ELB17]EAZ97696.1 hypothetical protein MELB17_24227 [Marinobacter sp. ELB17]
MTELSLEVNVENNTSNTCELIEESARSIVVAVKNKFLAIPENLHDALDEGTFNICELDKINSDISKLMTLRPEHERVALPTYNEKIYEFLREFHCENLSDYGEIVDYFPELIISIYDLDGESGTTLFGIDGQSEVLNKLRSFKVERKLIKDSGAKTCISTGTPENQSGNSNLFDVDVWLGSVTNKIASDIKSKFLAIPEHLTDAYNDNFFSVVKLNEINKKMETLKKLNTNYKAVRIPGRKNKLFKILGALHCEELADYDVELVNGLPEIIVLAYDLNGKSGETLFGIDGQAEVLEKLREFRCKKTHLINGFSKSKLLYSSLAIFSLSIIGYFIIRNIYF